MTCVCFDLRIRDSQLDGVHSFGISLSSNVPESGSQVGAYRKPKKQARLSYPRVSYEEKLHAQVSQALVLVLYIKVGKASQVGRGSHLEEVITAVKGQN